MRYDARPLITRAHEVQRRPNDPHPLLVHHRRTCEFTGIARPSHVASDGMQGEALWRHWTFPACGCTVTRTYQEVVMDTLTYTAVRANLARAMDRVCDDHEALIITRNGEQSVVMLSLEDYKALEETAYLLRTPANAKRLLSAVAQLNAGKGVERKLAK